MQLIDYAKHYVGMGLSVIPVKAGDKSPAISDLDTFLQRQPTQDELNEWFRGKTTENVNIGIVAGVGGLIIVDCDEPSLISVLELEKGENVVETSRGSHFYFIGNETENLEVPGLVELKANRKYCVAPPSIHKAGKEYRWSTGLLNKIPRLNASEESALKHRIFVLKNYHAAIEALANCWNEGIRHNLSLYLSGFLRKDVGLKEEDAKLFVKYVCALAGDNQIQDRLKAVEDTYCGSEAEVAGFVRLSELLSQTTYGSAAVKQIRKLGHSKQSATNDESAHLKVIQTPERQTQDIEEALGILEEPEQLECSDEEIYNLVRDYIKANWYHPDERYYDVIASFVLSTWRREVIDWFPKLWFHGPKKTGKSRALEILKLLCYRAVKTLSITEAAAIRVVDEHHVTLLVNQVALKGKEGLQDLFCADSSDVALRVEGDKVKFARGFAIAGPIAFGSIDEPRDDLIDRNLKIPTVFRKRVGSQKFSYRKEIANTKVLRRKLSFYREQHFEEDIPEIQTDIEDPRLNDIVAPLLGVATANGRASILSLASEIDEVRMMAIHDTEEAHVWQAIKVAQKQKDSIDTFVYLTDAAAHYYDEYEYLSADKRTYLNRNFAAVARRLHLETKDKNKLGEKHKAVKAIIYPPPEKEKELDEQYGKVALKTIDTSYTGHEGDLTQRILEPQDESQNTLQSASPMASIESIVSSNPRAESEIDSLSADAQAKHVEKRTEVVRKSLRIRSLVTPSGKVPLGEFRQWVEHMKGETDGLTFEELLEEFPDIIEVRGEYVYFIQAPAQAKS